MNRHKVVAFLFIITTILTLSFSFTREATTQKINHPKDKKSSSNNHVEPDSVAFQVSNTAPKNNVVTDTTKTHSGQEITTKQQEPLNKSEKIDKIAKLPKQLINDLRLSDFKEENHTYYATTTTPNDPQYSQWYLENIEAPLAWDISKGASSTIVAVIDTGFALSHQDLQTAWHTNPNETGNTENGDTCWTGSPEDKSSNNCDDDENGYTDDWRGWDFFENDNNVQTQTNDSNGSSHGTKVAGLVGARTNNGIGVSAINWNTKILPLQGLSDTGVGYSSDITTAIYYAVSMGADVINLSLGGANPDSYTRAAIQYANRNNVIVVTSSGNCGDTQSTPECTGFPSPGGMGYPARYPETIAVGATTQADTHASFSSWGDEITLTAPGSGSIITPTWTSGNSTSAYSSTSFGTSFSSPIVAGTIALLKDRQPRITTDEVISLIINSSDKTSDMSNNTWTSKFGWGRLNAFKLLKEQTKYINQLVKATGTISHFSSPTKPQISTNTGHTNESSITSGETARSYCITTPNTLCTLTITRQSPNPSITYTADSKLSNIHGVAYFDWSYSDLSTGEWSSTVTSNSQTSNPETLYVN